MGFIIPPPTGKSGACEHHHRQLIACVDAFVLFRKPVIGRIEKKNIMNPEDLAGKRWGAGQVDNGGCYSLLELTWNLI